MEAGLVVLIVVVVLAVIGALVFFSRDARIKRAIRKAKQVYVSDVVEGTAAKVVGTLSYTGQILTAPLSGRQCAFYEVVVEEYRSSGKSGSWREIIKETRFADFFLQDSSGRAMIRMNAAQVVVVKDSHSKSGTFDNATGIEEAFLRKHGRKSEGWVFNKKIRYKEGVLERGEHVAVYGHGTWEADPDPSSVAADYRGTARRLVMRTVQDAPLYVSDDVSTMR